MRCGWTQRIRDGENKDEGLGNFTKILDIRVNFCPPSQVRSRLLSQKYKGVCVCLLMTSLSANLQELGVDSDTFDNWLFYF